MLHPILFPSSTISLSSEALPNSCTKQLAAVANLSSSSSTSSSLVKRERSNINTLSFSWILGSILWGKADFYHSNTTFAFPSLNPQSTVFCGFFSVPYWSNFHSFWLLRPKHLSLCFLISPPFPRSFISMYFFHQAYKFSTSSQTGFAFSSFQVSDLLFLRYPVSQGLLQEDVENRTKPFIIWSYGYFRKLFFLYGKFNFLWIFSGSFGCQSFQVSWILLNIFATTLHLKAELIYLF